MALTYSQMARYIIRAQWPPEATAAEVHRRLRDAQMTVGKRVPERATAILRRANGRCWLVGKYEIAYQRETGRRITERIRL